jgi:hypothetical protein
MSRLLLDGFCEMLYWGGYYTLLRGCKFGEILMKVTGTVDWMLQLHRQALST